jgi:hypothetical protein
LRRTIAGVDVFVGVDVLVGVGVFVGVFVGVLVAVLVGVLVAVFVGVLVAVLVGVGVFVGVLVGVLVAAFVTTRVPLPDAVPLCVHALPLARTVKVVEPAGVAPVVVIVRVEVASAPVLVTEGGLNDALAPAGNAEVTLNGAVQELLLPLKPTVIVNVAELPATTGLGDCAPTIKVFGFASVKVYVMARPVC